MNSNCNNRNPLQRSGVNQYERVLHALLPTHARIDERDEADLILFAKNYARQLKYFNAANVEEGDWHVFMSMDVSVTLASFVKLDVEGGFAYVKKILDTIKGIDTIAESDLQNHFKVLFDFGFTVTALLDEYYKTLPADFEFKKTLKNIIQSTLPEYYGRLKKYYDEAVSQGVVDPGGMFTIEQAPFDILLSQDFSEGKLAAFWLDGSLPAFTPTFNGTSIPLKIRNTSTHNLFTGIFDQYLKTLTRIVAQAKKQLDITLTDFPTHSPHYGLYLTFLKLFRYAQEHLNTFSKRHLDLYYKEILQLYKKEAEPDQVHLSFELAKGRENHLIEEGTVFRAGKDVDGEEIFYGLTEDVVVNRGAVKSLKSIFVQKNLTENTRQVFASPVADSEDGLGAKLESADKSWMVFGDGDRTPATMGFVIASHYLYLKEGTRNITFDFHSPESSPISFAAADIQNSFSLQLTGEKGWVEVAINPSKVKIHPSKNYFSIAVSLDGGEPSIVPYSPKIHQENFNTSLPLAKFILKDARAKEAVWDFVLEKVAIQLHVTGIKDIAIQNDEGALSPSKPFDLFGAAPHPGSSFIIGSKEIFMKTLQPIEELQLRIMITWDNYADLKDKIHAEDAHTINVYHLEDAEWKTKAPHSDLTLFQGSEIDPITSLNLGLQKLDVEADYSSNETHSVKSKWGFVKVELNSDFGHSTYAKRLSDAAKGASITSVPDSSNPPKITTTIIIDPVEEPYTPKVKEITLEYSCSTEIDFSSTEEGAFIHLTPFGSKDLSTVQDRQLLPEVENEGEFYIGIENFTPDQSLSILFQLAEGSADPLQVKQEMSWYFLGEQNEWKEFQKENISDATNDLTQSGIIRFSISDEASAKNSLLTEQLHWLRATVAEKTQAVCKLIEVIAQAAKAEFADFKNTGNHFKNTLPAGTISKMVIGDSAIKKTNQPFASFNGRVKEEDDHFYVRVSERLRHKNRSIAMWDYERMVLEAFPSIYKAKCINHTQILEQTSGTQAIFIDNERKPGHVLLVPIPDLQNKNAFDSLRPYTSLGLLTEIKRYLYGCISPHVNLDVRNPRFEEIQLEFKIKYLTEDNKFYTKELKKELEQFLAPWAYEPGSDIEFGGKISKSVLIDFIEERPYVDFLSCIKMYQIVEGIKSADLDEAAATSARSVFVSVKADDPVNAHKISFIDQKCEC